MAKPNKARMMTQNQSVIDPPVVANTTTIARMAMEMMPVHRKGLSSRVQSLEEC